MNGPLLFIFFCSTFLPSSSLTTTTTTTTTTRPGIKYTTSLILGLPNVGKSTLLNKLVGTPFAVATNRPQTTRKTSFGIVRSINNNTEQNAPFLEPGLARVWDTPGIVDSYLTVGKDESKLWDVCMSKVTKILSYVDSVIVVLDGGKYGVDDNVSGDSGSGGTWESDLCVLKQWLCHDSSTSNTERRLIVVVNKFDKISPTAESALLTSVRGEFPTAVAVLPIAASTDKFCGSLDVVKGLLVGSEEQIISGLNKLNPDFSSLYESGIVAPNFLTTPTTQRLVFSTDCPRALLNMGDDVDELYTDVSERFIASEYIRGVIFEQLKAEIPYGTEVEITQLTEQSEKNKVRMLDATIYVNRESQKPIVIGAKGKQVKEIGIASRKKLETFFGSRIHLELSVKVLEGWRGDESNLKKFGYLS